MPARFPGAGSPYRDPITMAILKLQETGRLQMLYNKWWRNTGTCNADDKKKEKKANSLGVANVGGIFVVLVVGLIVAVGVAVGEFVWNTRGDGDRPRRQVRLYEVGPRGKVRRRRGRPSRKVGQ